MMYKINYFDLGLYDGKQMDWMVNVIFPSLKITNYNAYGFEANKKTYLKAMNRFKDNHQVDILHKGIADANKKTLLYHGFSKNKRRANADSIFYDKVNVNKKEFEEIECVLFSDWILKNVLDIKESFNILKFNIEGAEWYLMNDLITSGLYKYINIYCGAEIDIVKIKRFTKESLLIYKKLLNDHNINVLWFACSSSRCERETISNMEYNIKQLLKIV